MTRKQYRDLSAERDRLQVEHEQASTGLALSEWEEPLSSRAERANALYHQLRAVERRLEEQESHDPEFDEDWAVSYPGAE